METNAKLEMLQDAQAFMEALKQEQGNLQILCEWTLEPPSLLCSVSSGTEAVQLFQECLSKDLHHTLFRAFTETVEYAWFGTVGVRVELTSDGDLKANQQEYYANVKKAEDQEVVCKVRVQQLTRNGHVVYEKLLSIVQGGEA